MSPAGFQDAAVASSAIAVKAPPSPNARAPDPVGRGAEKIEGGRKVFSRDPLLGGDDGVPTCPTRRLIGPTGVFKVMLRLPSAPEGARTGLGPTVLLVNCTGMLPDP